MTAGRPGNAARPTPSADDRSRPVSPAAAARLWPYIAWACAGALLILLLSQIPVVHRVNIGGFDAAYVQGFHDPERAGSSALAGSDGSARWSRSSSALLFPQAGLPGEVTLHLRGLRESGPPPEITLLLNGAIVLDRFQSSGDWEERSLAITGGWLKVSDFFVEVRATPTTLADGREVGVLLDRATYRVGPGLVAPYPAQLAYVALAGLLLTALAGATRQPPAPLRPHVPTIRVAAGLLLYGLVWLLLYRMQPPFYPHPLRALPPLTVLALAAAVAIRDGPALATRAPWLVGVAAPAAVIAAWTVTTLVVGQGHVTLSRPGVENDFRVFATRETLAQVFSADGFYNLGYPLLLWLARPLSDGNAFLAGRLIAALAGATLLGAGYWMARALLPPGPALVALIALALSGLVAQYGLYVGSDMPFAACVALCAAAVAWAGRRDEQGVATKRSGDPAVVALAALAGVCGGLAFLMRHPGLVLLPWGALALLLLTWRPGARPGGLLQVPGVYCLAFILAMMPQLAINTLQAGQPLYNQQAKNIWLAVYGGTDWGRWEEVPDTIGLAEVVLRDPGRFLANWWRNVIGFTGSGAEDTSEFGRALQLRLLNWPANWLAVAGLLAWLLLALRALAGSVPPSPPRHTSRTTHAILLLIAGYVAAVSTAFILQRFFLPLAPLYAAAAGWTLWRLTGGGRRLLAATLALVVVLWGGYGAGAGYVLSNQPADEVAAIRMVAATAPPDAPIAARVSGRLPLAKYSAIAHRVVAWPVGSDSAATITPADLDAARAAGATLLLWDEAGGPPPLSTPDAARVASSGRYALYRLGP